MLSGIIPLHFFLDDQEGSTSTSQTGALECSVFIRAHYHHGCRMGPTNTVIKR